LELLKAVVISIIQGITEFLPISSSGHIFLLKNILKLEQGLFFDIVIHLGTLLAVIIFFRIEIYELIYGLFKKESNLKMFGDNLKWIDVLKIWLLFIIATIPAVIAGLFLNDFFDIKPSETQKWHFLFIAGTFTFTAVLLFSTYFIKNNNNKIKNTSIIKALIIGLFQAIAILPGVSRSGSTITAGKYVGLEEKDAARFSFLMSIPVILGAFILELFNLIENLKIADIKNNILLLIISFITSFIIGYLSLIFLIKILVKRKFWIFSIYLIIPVIISVILWIL